MTALAKGDNPNSEYWSNLRIEYSFDEFKKLDNNANAKFMAISYFMWSKNRFKNLENDATVSVNNNNEIHHVFPSNYLKTKFGENSAEYDLADSILNKIRINKISNIKILDAIYDLKILNQIRSNAFIYVHGHSVGGTNPSLVEAMASGLPIFAYDVSFNRYTTDNRCLYFKNEKELNSLILNINKNVISKIGIKMKQIANQKYKWSKIGQQYLNLFRNL
jgi:hypothetical protein